MNSSDRSSLVRLASSLPAGSAERKALISLIASPDLESALEVKTANTQIDLTELPPEQQKTVSQLSRALRMKIGEVGAGPKGYYVIFSSGPNRLEAKDMKMMLSFGVQWIEWGQFLAVGL